MWVDEAAAMGTPRRSHSSRTTRLDRRVDMSDARRDERTGCASEYTAGATGSANAIGSHPSSCDSTSDSAPTLRSLRPNGHVVWHSPGSIAAARACESPRARQREVPRARHERDPRVVRLGLRMRGSRRARGRGRAERVRAPDPGCLALRRVHWHRGESRAAPRGLRGAVIAAHLDTTAVQKPSASGL